MCIKRNENKVLLDSNLKCDEGNETNLDIDDEDM